MRQLLGRLVSLVHKGVLPTGPENMPLTTARGTATATASRPNGGNSAIDQLTDDEIDARIRVATAQLRKLGAFQDTSSIPMSHLNDEQLDERIHQVENELRKLNEGVPSDDGECREISRTEQEAVVRQLEVLDYLIEHPDATIPPASYLDALDDEPRRWARELLAMDEDLRRD